METNGKGSESDLLIFNGMEGFEESDDSTLADLLDDLHEDTLMTLLDDNLFARELCEHPFEEDGNNVVLQGNSFDMMHSLNLEMDDTSLMIKELLNSGGETDCLKEECLSNVEHHREGKKRVRNDSSYENMSKKVKLAKQSSTPLSKFSTALAGVMHDHCYASMHEEQHNSNTNSDEEASNEEGSSSDTGKHVMSNCVLCSIAVGPQIVYYLWYRG